jgi:hypothetical protein
VSEYQYYEFLAVDRPLDADQLDRLRALSTRAELTSTSFVNTYHWGDFKGNPRALMEEYFDAFLYTANWGSRQFDDPAAGPAARPRDRATVLRHGLGQRVGPR